MVLSSAQSLNLWVTTSDIVLILEKKKLSIHKFQLEKANNWSFIGNTVCFSSKIPENTATLPPIHRFKSM